MKCTDFWEKQKELKRLALHELGMAVDAHGGRYSWCDENGEIPQEVEVPCVCVFLDSGPTDVNIKEVIHDEKGLWISGESVDDYCPIDVTIDDPYDICDAYSIQSITEKIPETEDVKAVEYPQPQAVVWLDRDDLKTREFDGSDLTNEQLAEIASRMGSTYLDYSYWDDMEEACNYYKVPKLDEEETEE